MTSTDLQAKLRLYLSTIMVLTTMMLTLPWGSAYLSAIILITYFSFQPEQVFHPNNMVFASYGLYVVLSSTLTLILDLVAWEYVLPWGQIMFWKEMSNYLLFQVEFTFLFLFFGIHYFVGNVNVNRNLKFDGIHVRKHFTNGLYILSAGLVLVFIQSTAGISEWINNYSHTYLTKREGHGLLNVTITMLGYITVYLLGIQTEKSVKKWPIIIKSLLLCLWLSYIAGIKSRLIFLLIVYFSPRILKLRLNLKVLGLSILIFLVLLYVTTLFRTEFYYAPLPYFLEMLVGYFNSYQLHDNIVTSRDPALFQTVWQVFVKPAQILGLTSPDESFDISVMLTKEFFPDQWIDEHSTQQWPIETELYLNYFGIYLSWVPLLLYASALAWLYRLSVLRRNYWLLLIYLIEFQRIFSTLRGTLIPWETPIYLMQYVIIYLVCQYAIKRPTTAKIVTS